MIFYCRFRYVDASPGQFLPSNSWPAENITSKGLSRALTTISIKLSIKCQPVFSYIMEVIIICTSGIMLKRHQLSARNVCLDLSFFGGVRLLLIFSSNFEGSPPENQFHTFGSETLTSGYQLTAGDVWFIILSNKQVVWFEMIYLQYWKFRMAPSRCMDLAIWTELAYLQVSLSFYYFQDSSPYVDSDYFFERFWFNSFLPWLSSCQSSKEY